MRFDLHCHTKNGSLDGQVDIEEYAKLLRSKGFDGMLVTDHNSYNGYRAWKKVKASSDFYEDFHVIKGIEYDTLDAGHILVIMPDDVKLRILEVRGLPVSLLIRVVHKYGGILGPAHPFGAKFLSAMCSKKMQISKELIHQFDFVEAFNTCEVPESNMKARAFAEKYKKPTFGGSDAHRTAYIGTAYTDIDAEITCANDLIKAVHENAIVGCGGKERQAAHDKPIMKLVPLELSWKIYNNGLAILKSHKRKGKLMEIFQLKKYKTARKLVKAHR